MAYVDRRAEGNRAATIIAVAALHGFAAYALVTGLGVKYVKEITTVLRGENIPLEPPPPPPPDPQPSTAKTDEPQLVAPKPLVKVPPARDTVLIVPPAPTFDGPIIDYVPKPPTPEFSAPSPSPSFTPRAAVPRGSPANWVSTNDYPARDLREGNQGLVRFSLVIGTGGRVESCVVTQSRASPGLDDATCRFVMRRAKFEPATGAQGEPVKGSYAGSIRWVIPD